MVRFAKLAAVSLALLVACESACYESCQDQYEDCLNTGRSQDECSSALQNCEDSCEPQPQY